MNRDDAVTLLDRLHAAQNEFYAGGSGAALEQILDPDIPWTVPGDNSIAGAYHGLAEVLGYFQRRRDLAGRTFQLRRRDILVVDTDRVAALTDGVATIHGVAHQWSTVACTTSPTGGSQHAGCSRSTPERSTPSGAADARADPSASAGSLPPGQHDRPTEARILALWAG